MSAYLCNASHLAAIARELGRMDERINAEQVFGILLDENLKSIGARYPESSRISDWFDDGEAAFIWENIPEESHTAAELARLVSSYRYQSCEHEGWMGSTAETVTAGLLLILAPRVEAEEKVEADIKAARHAARQALPALYPKESAKEIRKVLRREFPATKFSVTTARGSMVSAVDIAWTDGPTTARVDALVKCFEAGRFDGMTDCYDFDSDTALLIEGKAYRPACQYVMTQRSISPKLAQNAAKLVGNYYGMEAPAILDKGHYWVVEPSQSNTARERTGEDWSTLIHRACSDRSRFTHSTVAHNV